MKTTPLMAVVGSHVFVVVASPHEGTSPVVTISSRHIGATAVAPKFLGTAPILRMLTPVVRIVVVVTWEMGVGLTGHRALESSSLISSKDPIEKGGARRRSSRGDPLPPESGEPGSRPGPIRFKCRFSNYLYFVFLLVLIIFV